MSATVTILFKTLELSNYYSQHMACFLRLSILQLHRLIEICRRWEQFQHR